MGWRRRLRDSGGFSAVEMVVTLGIMAVVLAILVPRFSPQSRYFDGDVREFVDNLQVARNLALSRTLHYRLRVTSVSAYVVEQGVFGGGSWTFPTIVRSVTLHTGVGFDTGSVGQTAEFDTRGGMVGATLAFSLVNSDAGSTKTILAYPTGMVETQ